MIYILRPGTPEERMHQEGVRAAVSAPLVVPATLSLGCLLVMEMERN